jgi:GxxExxY protein
VNSRPAIWISREVEIPVSYKGEKLGTKRIDFLVGEVMVEIKACSAFLPEHFVQALSYLRATGYRTGLLLNFGADRVGVKRLANG